MIIRLPLHRDSTPADASSITPSLIPILPFILPSLRYVFSSRRYFILTSTALLCYPSRGDQSEVRETLALTSDTQVVEMKTKGREGKEGGEGGNRTPSASTERGDTDLVYPKHYILRPTSFSPSLPPSLLVEKLKFRVKNEAFSWTLAADDDNEEEGRKWVEAIATAVARLNSFSADGHRGGEGGSKGGHAHTPARKVVVIEVSCRLRKEGRMGGGRGTVTARSRSTRFLLLLLCWKLRSFTFLPFFPPSLPPSISSSRVPSL